ncbi:anti-sigma factor antagonist [Halomonas sp. ND22Bw]|uniref:Anti-sigma factor antagonist n=1 Tax=Halomonas salina TaxID=42565 RepID=A0ABR4WXV6_9GAMM|nr:STAS domain-containing protein [Halomonas salina]KGE79563.1 anti-sigma factor antagonist [Halomonas salina]PSJ21496.1 anti-sigma factor antagonist [Halomonas sp. ND22Bw]
MSVLLENGANRLEVDGEVLSVSGEVDFDGAAEIAAAGQRWLASQSEGSRVVFDLGGVGRVSSAAVSVLLEWTRQSRAGGLALEAVRLSPPLARLTEVAGVDTLLPVEASVDATEA